jgi:sensor histidine kinase regulating citrate/malate metabolism
MITLGCWVIQPWGMIGSIFFCAIGICTFFVGINFYQKRLFQFMEVSEAEKTKELLSKQRHDWLNHVQVLMGYQMMKKNDQIGYYLQKLVTDANRERIISNICYAPLAVFLLTLSVKYKEWEWEVSLADSFEITDDKEAKRLLDLMKQIIHWLQKQGMDYLEWTKIKVMLSQDGRTFSIKWTLADEEGKTIPLDVPQAEWQELEQQIQKNGAELFSEKAHQGMFLRYVS